MAQATADPRARSRSARLPPRRRRPQLVPTAPSITPGGRPRRCRSGSSARIDAELERLFDRLSEGGTVFMPLDDYGFSTLLLGCTVGFDPVKVGVTWRSTSHVVQRRLTAYRRRSNNARSAASNLGWVGSTLTVPSVGPGPGDTSQKRCATTVRSPAPAMATRAPRTTRGTSPPDHAADRDHGAEPDHRHTHELAAAPPLPRRRAVTGSCRHRAPPRDRRMSPMSMLQAPERRAATVDLPTVDGHPDEPRGRDTRGTHSSGIDRRLDQRRGGRIGHDPPPLDRCTGHARSRRRDRPGPSRARRPERIEPTSSRARRPNRLSLDAVGPVAAKRSRWRIKAEEPSISSSTRTPSSVELPRADILDATSAGSTDTAADIPAPKP